MTVMTIYHVNMHVRNETLRKNAILLAKTRFVPNIGDLILIVVLGDDPYNTERFRVVSRRIYTGPNADEIDILVDETNEEW